MERIMRTILLVVFSTLALSAIALGNDYPNNPSYVNNNDNHLQDVPTNRHLVRSNTYNGDRRNSVDNQQYPSEASERYNDYRGGQRDQRLPNQINDHRRAPRNINDYDNTPQSHDYRQDQDDRYYKDNNLSNEQVIEHPDSYRQQDMNRNQPSSNVNVNEANTPLVK